MVNMLAMVVALTAGTSRIRSYSSDMMIVFGEVYRVVKIQWVNNDG